MVVNKLTIPEKMFGEGWIKHRYSSRTTEIRGAKSRSGEPVWSPSIVGGLHYFLKFKFLVLYQHCTVYMYNNKYIETFMLRTRKWDIKKGLRLHYRYKYIYINITTALKEIP